MIGDANSIHIRRWAGWLRLRGHFVSIISLTRVVENYPDYDLMYYVPPMTGPLAYTRRIAPIRRLVKKVLRPDIVHGHYMTSSGFYSALSGCKHIIASAWGSDIYSDSKQWLKRQAIKLAMEYSDVVLADSDHLVQTTKALRPKTDVRKVVFGIDIELFQPNPVKHDKFRFLSLRATSSIYNPRIIVEAFDRADLDAELWMSKPSPECFDVYDYVKARPELDGKVIWLDKRPYDQMPELYNSVDVGISIASWDSSSTAMNECMACGVPVIASDIPQNREWIDRSLSNGFLSDISIDALAQWMLTAMKSGYAYWPKSDVALLQIYGHHARKKIIADADFNTEMSKAERIYQEVLDAKE